MPPLHKKLSTMKQFVKVVAPNSEPFEYLNGFFPKISDAKMDIFIRPQIKELM